MITPYVDLGRVFDAIDRENLDQFQCLSNDFIAHSILLLFREDLCGICQHLGGAIRVF